MSFQLPRRLFLLASLSLSGCWPLARNSYLVEDVPQRPELRQQAQEISVEDFFARRMANRVRKAPVGNWMVLYEDAEFVYIGYPRFRGLLDNKREIEGLFRTSRKALDAHFPGWKQIDGESVREALYLLFKQAPAQWQAQLEKDCLRVTGTLAADPAHPGPPQTFEKCLDKRTLK